MRFYISWIVSAILMYAAFYVWHGIFLTDLNRIEFSKALFLILAALVYLVISLALYRTYESKLLVKYFSQPIVRGIVSGVLLGFILFSIITVLGISFTKNVNITYIIVDCAWQVAEQILGGIVIGLGKIMIFEPTPEMIRNHD